MKKALIITTLFLAVLLFYIKSCTAYKLNEATFYKDKNIELKIIRYQENLFLHYSDPTFRVACKSKNTKPRSWGKVQEPSWTEIPAAYPALVNLGPDPSLSTLTEAAKSGYYVADINTLIYRAGGAGITVSWDGCATFRSWSPTKLPNELVEQEKYLQCLKESKIKEDIGSLATGWGKKNCKSKSFHGDNIPTFSSIETTHTGDASFIVTSKAFKEGKSYQVTTNDYGVIWKVKEINKQE